MSVNQWNSVPCLQEAIILQTFLVKDNVYCKNNQCLHYCKDVVIVCILFVYSGVEGKVYFFLSALLYFFNLVHISPLKNKKKILFFL